MTHQAKYTIEFVLARGTILPETWPTKTQILNIYFRDYKTKSRYRCDSNEHTITQLYSVKPSVSFGSQSCILNEDFTVGKGKDRDYGDV